MPVQATRFILTHFFQTTVPLSEASQSRCKQQHNWWTDTADGRKYEDAEVIGTGWVHEHFSILYTLWQDTSKEDFEKEQVHLLIFMCRLPRVGEKYKSRSLL